MAGGCIRENRQVVVPFCTIYAFGGHKVRIGSLPAARECGSMEIDEKAVSGSILHEVDIIVHVFGVVSVEEVHFDAVNPLFFKPGVFFLPVFFFVEPVVRGWGSVNPVGA